MASLTIYADQVAANMKLFDGATDSSATNYSNARNGAVADTVYATNIGQVVGQYNSVGGGTAGADAFSIWRAVLIFAIPADLPSIVGAKLTLHNEAGTAWGSGPQYVYCVAVEGDVADDGVVAADYGDIVDNITEWGSFHSSLFVNNTDFDIVLSAAAITHINSEKGSKALFALRSEDDIDATLPDSGASDYMIFAGSTDVTTTQRPRLIITYADTFPTDDLSRVTGIRHIYKPGFFRMILSLGDVSNTIEIAEAKVRKELEIPEQQTPKPEPYPFAEEPRAVPPTPYRTGIIPPGPEPVAPEPGRPRIFPTTPGIVMPEETFRKIFPEAKPPTEPPTFGKVLGAAVRAAIPSPIRKAWRAITPWEEEAGETFGGEVAERFKSIRRFFGG